MAKFLESSADDSRPPIWQQKHSAVLVFGETKSFFAGADRPGPLEAPHHGHDSRHNHTRLASGVAGKHRLTRGGDDPLA